MHGAFAFFFLERREDDMPEYQSNSHRTKELAAQEKPAERRTEKVVTGGTKLRKKSALTKTVNAFLPGDVDDVKRYVLMDVLVPTIKRTISDVVRNAVDMLLGVNTTPRSSSPAGTRVSYRSYYDARDDRRESTALRPRSTPYSYDDVVFDRYDDAAEVLLRMRELVSRFDAVSVADLFDMTGHAGNYTDNKYGWTDLSDARVERVSDGYIIRLPRPIVL